jgi:hypothetical protein
VDEGVEGMKGEEEEEGRRIECVEEGVGGGKWPAGPFPVGGKLNTGAPKHGCTTVIFILKFCFESKT